MATAPCGDPGAHRSRVASVGHPRQRRKRVTRVTKPANVRAQIFAPNEPRYRSAFAVLQRCGFSFEPLLAVPVERLELGSRESRHVGLHGLSVLGLQIGEMAVSFRKPREQRRIELHGRGWIDRHDAVAFIDRLAQHDAPTALALLQEIVEAAAADHVAHDALDWAALRDLHLGLRDGAVAGEIDAHAAVEVRRAGAARKTLLADPDELVDAALEPGRHHDAVGMPERAEIVPAADVAPHRPVVDQFADREAVADVGVARHSMGEGINQDTSRECAPTTVHLKSSMFAYLGAVLLPAPDFFSQPMKYLTSLNQAPEHSSVSFFSSATPFASAAPSLVFTGCCASNFCTTFGISRLMNSPSDFMAAAIIKCVRICPNPLAAAALPPSLARVAWTPVTRAQ